jgi:hypothetical protein
MVWGWISRNPVPLTTPPAVEPPDSRPPEVGQAERLTETAMAEDPELGLFLVLAVVLAVLAATGEAADLLGVPDRGVLRQGAAADITALQRPLAMFQDGRQIR